MITNLISENRVREVSFVEPCYIEKSRPVERYTDPVSGIISINADPGFNVIGGFILQYEVTQSRAVADVNIYKIAGGQIQLAQTGTIREIQAHV